MINIINLHFKVLCFSLSLNIYLENINYIFIFDFNGLLIHKYLDFCYKKMGKRPLELEKGDYLYIIGRNRIRHNYS